MKKIFAKISSMNGVYKAFLVYFLILLLALTYKCFPIFDQSEIINNLSFSHDGKKIVFDRCRNVGCQIQVYDLATGELAAYKSPLTKRWTMGKYSYDGKKITFSIIPIKITGDLNLNKMQIAVMDADGKNFKKVTTGPGAKLYPTFSHNGKKILYARAARIREKGKTPAADYDAWEVDLTTGKQTQLSHFEYFYMGYLSYFPDDERFMYYGELPSIFEGERLSAGGGGYNPRLIELAKRGMGIHAVVEMKGKDLIPTMYNFGDKVVPEKPLLSKDGSVLIFGKAAEAGTFYLYSSDGNHRLVGSGGSVDSAAISPDGTLLGMISVKLGIHIFSVPDGQRQKDLYVPYAKKKIVNWKESHKGNKYLYKMIPEKPSRILN